MAERKFTILLFLFGFFVFLSIIVGMWIYGIYTEKSAYATTTSNREIQCASLYFDIKNLEYTDGILSFDIENTIGDQFSELTIQGLEKKAITLADFYSGSTQHVQTDLVINQSVLIYPAGCKDSNAKTYKI